MPAQKHIIKKFSLELQVSNTQQSYALQHRCMKLVKEGLVNDMDEVLSAYFKDDTITRINKIEIDLGNINTEDLEKDFVAKCMTVFTGKIKTLSLKQTPSEENEINNISSEENNIEQFFYFLLSGKISWAMHGINFSDWQVSLVAAIKNKKGSFFETLSEVAARQPATIERLIMQFDDMFIMELISINKPSVKAEIENVIQLLQTIIPLDQIQALRKKILQTILPVLLDVPEKMSENKTEQLIQSFNEAPKNALDEKIIHSLKENIIALVKKIDMKFGSFELKKPSGEKEPIEVKQAGEKKDAKAEKTEGIVEDKSVFIDNAGLVILHPFLHNLFKATALMEVEVFNDDFSKQKAVHLLQYLANGQQQLPEYMMPLNKILCGMPDEEHIDRFIQVEEAELKEADELLKAVITHWAALKNTSPAAMQETFFQRKGKLTFNESNYWKLQIERKAVDLLLDKIPWGISYIQLPWMKHALKTEW